ncbi:MAG: hypothetical protein AAF957_17170 [Planctomycetota bacterium]
MLRRPGPPPCLASLLIALGAAPVAHAAQDVRGPLPARAAGMSAAVTGSANAAGLPEGALSPPPLERPWHDVDGEGRLWTRGTTYKASFDADGFTYVPFLGSDAPRIWPVRMRLVAAERGGVPLALETAEVTREGDRVVLDRGPVRVLYDTALDGVEQSFAFERAPEGTGDLVLRMEVETDLAARVDGAGFRFDADRGGVQYGAATAFDGAGRGLGLAATHTGDGIEVVVPASFVDAAEGTLLVDPLITTFVLEPVNATHAFPDAAFDVTNDRWCVVCQEDFAGSDADIISWFVDGTTYARSGSGFVDGTTIAWRTPAVANQNFDDVFCVVAATETTAANNIVARYRDATTGAFQPPFIVEFGASFDAAFPDIGGDSFATSFDSYFMVVWERDDGTNRDVVGVVMDSAGNFVGSKFEIAAEPGRSEQKPAISKSTGNPVLQARFNVAWIESPHGDTSGSVHCRQYTFLGNPVSGPFEVWPTSGAREVDVSCLLDLSTGPPNFDQLYLVTWDEDFGPDRDVIVAMCAGAERKDRRSLWGLEGVPFEPDQRRPAVAATDDQWIVAYFEGGMGFFAGIYGAVLDPVGDLLGLTEARVQYQDDISTAVALCTAYSGGGISSDDALALWTRPDTTGNDLMAGIHRTTTTRAAGAQYCVPNPNSTGDRGFLVATGDQGATSPKTLVASQLPPFSVGFFLSAETFGFTPNPAGSQGNLCLSGPIGRYSGSAANSGPDGVISLTIDPAAIQTPLGPVAAVAGDTWYFQAWHRDSVGGTSTSNFTNAVQMPIQ